MSAEPGGSPHVPTVAAQYECEAQRLRAMIAGALQPDADFPAQIDTALRAALALFAAEPELARLLIVRPFEGDPEALRCYERWQRLGAELLRAAAARDPGAHVHPPFVEPALISGICFHLSRRLLAAGPEHLEDLLPDLLEFVLVCYFGPERVASLLDPR